MQRFRQRLISCLLAPFAAPQSAHFFPASPNCLRNHLLHPPHFTQPLSNTAHPPARPPAHPPTHPPSTPPAHPPT